MIEYPKISVITPSYNQAEFLEKTIHSVLSQEYPNLEYLVFDGGSTDGSVEILKRYSNHLFWVSQKDGGQSNAINRGFKLASGEVIAYLNSDDIYEPRALLAVGDFFRSHPTAYWVTGKCHIVDENGRRIRRVITAYKNLWLCFRNYKVLQVLDYVSQPATFWRRSLVDTIGLLDEDLFYTMDYDYSLRVGRENRLYFIDKYLASFRIHSLSKSRSVDDHFASDLATAKKYTRSRLLLYFHSIHNRIIVLIYKLLQ